MYVGKALWVSTLKSDMIKEVTRAWGDMLADGARKHMHVQSGSWPLNSHLLTAGPAVLHRPEEELSEPDLEMT